MGVRAVSDLRKRKSSAFCGPLQAMRSTTVGMRRAIRWPWLCDAVQPCSSVSSICTPEMPQRGEGIGIGPAAELAVGDDLQADVFLQLDHAGNGIVLDRRELAAIEFSRGVLMACAQELRRPQQAADMFGAERRRTGHGDAVRRREMVVAKA